MAHSPDREPFSRRRRVCNPDHSSYPPLSLLECLMAVFLRRHRFVDKVAYWLAEPRVNRNVGELTFFRGKRRHVEFSPTSVTQETGEVGDQL